MIGLEAPGKNLNVCMITLCRRDLVKNEIVNTVDEHIRALEEKKRRLVENLDGIFQSKEKVSYDSRTLLHKSSLPHKKQNGELWLFDFPSGTHVCMPLLRIWVVKYQVDSFLKTK